MPANQVQAAADRADALARCVGRLERALPPSRERCRGGPGACPRGHVPAARATAAIWSDHSPPMGTTVLASRSLNLPHCAARSPWHRCLGQAPRPAMSASGPIHVSASTLAVPDRPRPRGGAVITREITDRVDSLRYGARRGVRVMSELKPGSTPATLSMSSVRPGAGPALSLPWSCLSSPISMGCIQDDLTRPRGRTSSSARAGSAKTRPARIIRFVEGSVDSAIAPREGSSLHNGVLPRLPRSRP